MIAGTVLVDPMSLLLHAADGPRNFFRTRARTASERFFRYFALERGISHYLARHLRWSDSVLFAGETGPAALPDRVVKALVPKCAQEPLEPPFDVPNYAPFVTPCPAGPVVGRSTSVVLQADSKALNNSLGSRLSCSFPNATVSSRSARSQPTSKRLASPLDDQRIRLRARRPCQTAP